MKKESHFASEIERCFESFDESISSVERAYQRVWRQLNELTPQAAIPRDFLVEMAGNLAHEIRNPLGGIANFVELLSDGQEGQESKSVQGILAGVSRIDKVVENLIVFSKPVVLQRINCNFSDVVRTAVSISKQELGASTSKLEFQLQLPKREVFVKVDPQLMLNALKNVLQNSIENVTVGGRITVVLDQDVEANEMALTICDNGRGLPEGNTEKPFYPFFTTKTYGMGLGLPTARLILEEHGCKISLANNHKEGVTATIHCPFPGMTKLI